METQTNGASTPKNQKELDRAIQKIDNGKQTKRAIAQTIVGQMLPDGVAKGGSALMFRFGNQSTRFTKDLDTARLEGIEEYINLLEKILQKGWNGFTGHIIKVNPASPEGIAPEYIMQPFEIKMQYYGKSWTTVELEVGHNELGDAENPEYYISPDAVALFKSIGLPEPKPIALIPVSHQIAQKLHAVTTEGDDRAHDLIDLQLLEKYEDIDYARTKEICVKLFEYRNKHTWPPIIEKTADWDALYDRQRRDIDVLPTVDKAVAWGNEFIARIDSE